MVSTPPKSETTASIMRAAGGRSGRCRCRPAIRQRTNEQSSRSAPRSSVEPHTHLAGRAPRVVVVLAHPQLERGALLAALVVVRRRQPRLVDAQGTRGADHGRPRLVAAMGAGARRADRAQHDAGAVLQPGRQRPRGLDPLPVGVAPRVGLRWPRQRTWRASRRRAARSHARGRAARRARCRRPGPPPRRRRARPAARWRRTRSSKASVAVVEAQVLAARRRSPAAPSASGARHHTAAPPSNSTTQRAAVHRQRRSPARGRRHAPRGRRTRTSPRVARSGRLPPALDLVAGRRRPPCPRRRSRPRGRGQSPPSPSGARTAAPAPRARPRGRAGSAGSARGCR